GGLPPRSVVESLARGFDGSIYVGGARGGNVRDHFFGRRIVYRKRLTRCGGDPLAVHVILESLHIRFYTARHVFLHFLCCMSPKAGTACRARTRPSSRCWGDGFQFARCFSTAVHEKEKCGEPDEQQRSAEHPHFVRHDRSDLLRRKKR